MSQNLTSTFIHRRYQNHGYEYLSSIYRIREEHDHLTAVGITPYIMPVKVLSIACMAIEEYINEAGFLIDPDWKEFDHKTGSIKNHVARIYELIGEPVRFNTGTWKNVLELFRMNRLIDKDSLALIRYRQEEIPGIIIEAVKNYPITLSQAIAEDAIEQMINCISVGFPLKTKSVTALV